MSLEIFIPARSGSKRVKNKNLQKINGISLLEKKIQTCKKIPKIKIVVSTNSQKIAHVAKKNGAIVPFLRKEKYATSKASTISVILEYLRYLKKNKLIIPDFLMVLPVTNPFLRLNSITKAIKLINVLKKNKKINSILSYTASEEHPYLYVYPKKKKLEFNLFKYKNYKYSDLERTQDWPKAFVGSAALKITRTKFFLNIINNNSPNLQKKTFDLNNTIGVLISKNENFDINNFSDLQLARSLSELKF